MSHAAAAAILTTDAAMARFLQVIQRSKSYHTWRNYSKAMRSVRPFLPDHYEDITWENLLDWQNARAAQKLPCGKPTNPNTTDSYLTGIKSWCRWVGNMYDLSHNPAAKIKYLVSEKKRLYKHRVLSQTEVERIVSEAGKLRRDPVYNQHAQDAILWLAHTGIRTMEFRSLSWECFSKDRATFEVFGKGRKRRVVPCDNAVCQAIITRYKDQPDVPFVTRFAQTPYLLQNLCVVLARRAGIERFGPHALRHYYVTRMAELGVPIKVISMIIGHSNTEITEYVYTHLNTASVMGWSQKLNVRSSPGPSS